MDNENIEDYLHEVETLVADQYFNNEPFCVRKVVGDARLTDKEYDIISDYAIKLYNSIKLEMQTQLEYINKTERIRASAKFQGTIGGSIFGASLTYIISKDLGASLLAGIGTELVFTYLENKFGVFSRFFYNIKPRLLGSGIDFEKLTTETVKKLEDNTG